MLKNITRLSIGQNYQKIHLKLIAAFFVQLETSQGSSQHFITPMLFELITMKLL